MGVNVIANTTTGGRDARQEEEKLVDQEPEDVRGPKAQGNAQVSRGSHQQRAGKKEEKIVGRV
jgi:hypothetical protein